jgi:hypothetical protein
MAGIFGKTKHTSTAAEQLDKMAVQTSGYGRCIPIVYGRARVAANLIFYDDFTAHPHTETTRTGKGGGGSRQTDTTYTYTAAVMLAICEGPVELTGRVWVDKDYYEGNGLAALGMSFFKGGVSQSAWPYVASRHPAKAVGYGSTAYAAHPRLDLGSSGSTKNHSFEVMGYCAGANAAGDANAADMVFDMLTHNIHGMGFPGAAIDSLADYRLYTKESGLLVTAVYDDQKTGLQCLQTLLECTNSIAIWSGGKLRLLPLGDLPIGAWRPDSTPLYALTVDDFIGSADPVKVRRKTSADAHNSVKVNFNNRGIDYAEDVAAADDLAMQDLFGIRPAQEFKADCIAEAKAAQTLAQIQLQRYVGIRNEYEFNLGWRYILLEPGDLVTLTEPGLGLNNTPVRIVSTEESAEGGLTIVAEDWPNGIATAVAYPAPPRGGNGPNMAVEPGHTNPPVIFEPPGDLTGGMMEAWVGASGGEWWGGCEVWASRDGSTYGLAGRINAPARHGSLTGPIGRHGGMNPDNGSALPVDLSISKGTLISASQADADHWETLSFVGGELLSYQNAAMAGGHSYRLSVLRRGLFGSANMAHSSGESFMRLDEAVIAIDLGRWDAGETIWLKFPAFNKFGQALQSLDEAAAYPYTIQGTALRTWAAPTECAIMVKN